jgi:hypothetical protein
MWPGIVPLDAVLKVLQLLDEITEWFGGDWDRLASRLECEQHTGLLRNEFNGDLVEWRCDERGGIDGVLSPRTLGHTDLRPGFHEPSVSGRVKRVGDRFDLVDPR